ncbi:ATP-dependent DNA helicase RecQ [Ichthyenterobacterium sp. W332]|uniref:ATP-dependent DNA helicase RecQ n=1 Tax=Microcosmobacter mediterraneus TaxID=3075607 RepID=A0ABU2YNK3_9FLAO|nr:ATP-dependent DNA helicase RecQ [Ichthyenterobacterium sp. W332]MDT0559412.1 ATP-dependent DNA helicase RecQ [Ichthyenterobacterium sp. W332]
MQQPLDVLERYWNYTSFRPLQQNIIDAVLNNEDTFALLPTGGGKSVCFQIPALIKEGICIVISPLVALMKDQVNQLNQKGIKAIALTSGISYTNLDTLLDNCIYGNYKFLYLSPERLQQTIVKERIQQMNVNLIAVDEAHCISQWGNDFRPAYKNISQLRELKPHVNVIALTATAKDTIIKEIIEELDFVAPKLFKGSFARDNIIYKVIDTEDKLYYLKLTLNKYPGTSIIYVRNRKTAENISNYLITKNFKSTFYHGGIDSNLKQERLIDWTADRTPIMVATTAFGMGIDKPNVRSVIHFNLPESIESYYQETGRAGRDGKSALAVILKQNTDEAQLKRQFLDTLPDNDFVKLVYKKLSAYFQISYGEGEQETFSINFNSFCNTYNLNKTITFNTLKLLDRHSIISLSQQFNYQTKIQFTISNERLFDYLNKNKKNAILVKVILRTYGGVFDHLTKINLNIISNKSELSQTKILEILKQLEEDNIITLITSNTDAEITFLVPREDDKTINVISKTITEQNNIKKEQVQSVIEYIKNETRCKSLQLLDYFGETLVTPCGKCSVCKLDVSAESNSNITNVILISLKNNELSSRELILQLNYSNQDIINGIKELLEEDKITITPHNTYRIK